MCRRPRTEGVKFEKEYAENKNLPDPTTTNNVEYKIVLSILKESIPKRPSCRDRTQGNGSSVLGRLHMYT